MCGVLSYGPAAPPAQQPGIRPGAPAALRPSSSPPSLACDAKGLTPKHGHDHASALSHTVGRHVHTFTTVRGERDSGRRVSIRDERMENQGQRLVGAEKHIQSPQLSVISASLLHSVTISRGDGERMRGSERCGSMLVAVQQRSWLEAIVLIRPAPARPDAGVHTGSLCLANHRRGRHAISLLCRIDHIGRQATGTRR